MVTKKAIAVKQTTQRTYLGRALKDEHSGVEEELSPEVVDESGGLETLLIRLNQALVHPVQDLSQPGATHMHTSTAQLGILSSEGEGGG